MQSFLFLYFSKLPLLNLRDIVYNVNVCVFSMEFCNFFTGR